MNRYYGRLASAPSQPPFRCEGFTRDAVIPASSGDPIPLEEVPPFLRALLVTDGTVTKILEAYFWEPVVVDTVSQCFEVATEAVPWIEVEAGDLINVPAGTKHWFNLCDDRHIRCIRLFQDPAGWAPEYVDSGVHTSYQPLCFGPNYLPKKTQIDSVIKI